MLRILVPPLVIVAVALLARVAYPNAHAIAYPDAYAYRNAIAYPNPAGATHDAQQRWRAHLRPAD